jgi:hypothetical protein
MDSEAVVPDSGARRLGFSLLSGVLAFLAVLLFFYGLVLVGTVPNVGVRPGVTSAIADDSYGPVTDCGGLSLRVIFRGAQVVAETSQQARAAEGACRRGAWTSVVTGLVLFLLMLVSLYGASRAKRRYERGGRLAGPKQLGPSGERNEI